MKNLIDIFKLIEDNDTLHEQLQSILTYTLKYLSLTIGSISIVHKKRRLQSEANPNGIELKLIASVGIVKSKRLEKQEKDSREYTESNTPIKHKGVSLGQITIIGIIPEVMIEEFKTLVGFIGILIHYENIKEECKSLKDEHELSKAKSMFMANVSHEIRTPLNAILGCLDYFNELGLQRAGQDVLDVMKHSSYNLLYLVNDILDISGLESDKMSLHLSPARLTDLITDAYKITHEAKPISVSFQKYIESDIPSYIITDCQRVKQIIINLLSNAFKFTEQGHVKLRVSLVNSVDLEVLDLPAIDSVSMTPNSSPKTEHYTYRKNSIDSKRKGKKLYIKLAVSDTGIGIKEKNVNKLFKSFSQIDSSTTKKYGGTGLGLAISSGFCKLLQGGISLVSEWKKGSTFYFIIPVQEYMDTNDVKIDLTILKGKLALIVDDKVDNIVRLTAILDKYDIQYHSTTNAKHAIASFVNNKKYTFDFGLLDVYMPEMDGNQLAEYIAKTDRPFPLIALSSSNTKLNDITGSFDVTINKPYNEDQLLQNIHSILTNRSVEASSTTVNQKQRRYRSLDSGVLNTTEPAYKQSKSIDQLSIRKLSINNESNISITNNILESSSSSEFRANTNIEIRILVVEDNEYNQFTIKRMLNGMGYYNIEVAGSGTEAIKMIQINLDNSSEGNVQSTYDVILMDIIMPGMDGITASRRIKRLFSDGNAPIIYALTANVVPGEEKKCISNGKMDGFIEKPINKAILADYLSKINIIDLH